MVRGFTICNPSRASQVCRDLPRQTWSVWIIECPGHTRRTLVDISFSRSPRSVWIYHLPAHLLKCHTGDCLQRTSLWTLSHDKQRKCLYVYIRLSRKLRLIRCRLCVAVPQTGREPRERSSWPPARPDRGQTGRGTSRGQKSPTQLQQLSPTGKAWEKRVAQSSRRVDGGCCNNKEGTVDKTGPIFGKASKPTSIFNPTSAFTHLICRFNCRYCRYVNNCVLQKTHAQKETDFSGRSNLNYIKPPYVFKH